MSDDARGKDALLAKLDRLNVLLAKRDLAIVDELWSGPGFLLVGSESGEMARTRDELASHMAAIFALPTTYGFARQSSIVARHGDVAWVFAECQLVVTSAAGETRRPYRMNCVFQNIDGHWRWRQFVGAEPVASAA